MTKDETPKPVDTINFEPRQAVAAKIADIIQTKYRFISTGKKDISHFWVYDAETGIWSPDGRAVVKSESSHLIANRGSNSLIAEVLGILMRVWFKRNFVLSGPAHKIVLNNGIFNLDTFEFSPEFEPDEYHVTRVAINYNPKATCPNFEQFLSEIVGREEDILAIQEIFGYCLYKDYTYAILPLFVGGGANGKSTLLDVLKRFLGSDNYTAVTPYQITVDKFKAALLYGKLANVCGDIPPKPLEYTDLIKALTGGDTISVEYKGKDAFEILSYAKLIFSANELPPVGDNTDAWFRRTSIIEFPHTFSAGDEGTKNRVDLVNSMTTQEELEGILNLALEGWKRLKAQNGKLTGDKKMEDKRFEYAYRSDSVKYFAMQYLERGTSQITKEHLYSMYKNMCIIEEMPTIVSQNVFTRRIKVAAEYISEERVTIDGEQVKVWTGVKSTRLFDHIEDEIHKADILTGRHQ
jgi:putative DNA primase/helicase